MGIFDKMQDKLTEINEKSKKDNIDKFFSDLEVLKSETSSEKEKNKAIIKLLFGRQKIEGNFKFKAIYVGGHYLQATTNGKLKTILLIENDGIVIDEILTVIPFKDIESIEIKNSYEIRNDVTLTRYFAFGLAALALPKKTTVTKNYFILKCKKDSINYSVVLEGSGSMINNFYKIMIEKISARDV